MPTDRLPDTEDVEALLAALLDAPEAPWTPLHRIDGLSPEWGGSCLAWRDEPDDEPCPGHYEPACVCRARITIEPCGPECLRCDTCGHRPED